QQGAQLYGTSGASDDWTFARHFLDPTGPVIYPYTIEFGRERPDDVAASFHPPYAEMERIIDEVVAGLLEMCLAGLDLLAAEQLPKPHPRPGRPRRWGAPSRAQPVRS